MQRDRTLLGVLTPPPPADDPAAPAPDPLLHWVRRVAGHGLTAGSQVPPRPPGVSGPSLVQALEAQGLTGLAELAVADGALSLSRADAVSLQRVHERTCRAAVRLEQALVDLAERLDDAGVAVRVLKGPALAHLAYPDPSLRPFGDIDVLIPPEQLEAARDLLASAGGRRRFPEPRAGYDRRFGKGFCVVVARGVEIDVHRTLCPGPFGLAIDPRALFVDPEPFSLGGRRLEALAPPARFLHACYHAALGSARPRLLALRDVAQTAPSDPAVVAEARRLAAAWQAEVVVAHAVAEAAVALGWTPPDALRDWEPARGARRQRRWLAAYVGGGRSPLRQALYGLEAVDGWADRGRYLVTMSRPGPGGRRWRRALSRPWRAVRRRGRAGPAGGAAR